MTDQKRDESRDIGVRVSRRPDDNIEMDCAPWRRVNPVTYGVSHYDHYVPHDDLVAAEERYSKLSRLTAALVTALVDDNVTFFGDSIVDATTVLQKELGI